MKKIKVLQLSKENWLGNYSIPDCFEWHYFFSTDSLYYNQVLDQIVFDFLIVDDIDCFKQLLSTSYQVFSKYIIFDKNMKLDEEGLESIFSQKKVQKLSFTSPQWIIQKMKMLMIGRKSSSKETVYYYRPANSCKEKMILKGRECLEYVDFCYKDYLKIADMENCFLLPKEECAIFWPEFLSSPTISLRYRINGFVLENKGHILKYRIDYDEKDQFQPLVIGPCDEDVLVFSSIYARGEGDIKLYGTHFREVSNKKEYEHFIDHILLDHKRGEVSFEFIEGSPRRLFVIFTDSHEYLNFSNMLAGESLLVFRDWRGSTGQFYFGKKEFRDKILQTIRHYMMTLQLTRKDIIILGHYMGGAAAMMYGGLLQSQHIMLVNPVIDVNHFNTGSVAYRSYLDVIYSQDELFEQKVEDFTEAYWEEVRSHSYEQSNVQMAYWVRNEIGECYYEEITRKLKMQNYLSPLLIKGFSTKKNETEEMMNEWISVHLKELS